MERIWLSSYPQGVPADIDPEAFRSIGDFLAASVARYRDKTAFVSMGKGITFAEFDADSRAFGAYLQNVARLPAKARVAIMMPNLLQYPVAAFGALRAGYAVVNCNPLYSPRELHHQLADSGADAIVVMEPFAHVLQKAIVGTGVQHVIMTGAGDRLGALKGTIVNFVLRKVRKAVPAYDLPGAVSFNAALAQGRRTTLDTPAVKPSDIAFLQYTGGTTGVPKGAMLTHRNILANLQQVQAWLAPAITPGAEVFITALPLYHVFALVANGFTPLMLGATNVLIPNPRDVPAFAKVLRSTRFTVITGVNTLFNLMLNEKAFDGVDYSHLKTALAGGMAVQRAVAERWKTRTGKPLIEAYGLTETSPAATINPLTLAEYNGSIGLPLSSTEIEIRDENGRELGVGEAGELCIRGPQVMAGYWEKPEETAAVLGADGFLRTGDIAKADERGFLYIVDRKKDMIIVSGFNVYPNEVEDVVMMHPGVREVGAVGVPDERSGEAVKIVVARKDASLTAEELLAHCRKELTGYKMPRYVEFRETLPRTPIGKILRRELKDKPETV